MAEKCFSQILMTFSSRDTIGTGLEQAKLKIRPEWVCFATGTYPQSLGCSSYRFRSIRLKNVSVKFWLLFWVWTPTEQAWSRQSWKSGPDDSILYPKHTRNVWGVVLIVSRLYGSKIFRSHFDDFFGTRKHQSRKSWKPGTNDLVLHLKHTHIVWGALLNVSGQYGWKMF